MARFFLRSVSWLYVIRAKKVLYVYIWNVLNTKFLFFMKMFSLFWSSWAFGQIWARNGNVSGQGWNMYMELLEIIKEESKEVYVLVCITCSIFYRKKGLPFSSRETTPQSFIALRMYWLCTSTYYLHSCRIVSYSVCNILHTS